MKICLRFVTELQLKLKLEQELQQELTFCWALFSLRSVRYVTLRFVSFIRSFRFSVCPKTFFHMHLSAKACHIPLLPYVPLRLDSTQLSSTLGSPVGMEVQRCLPFFTKF